MVPQAEARSSYIAHSAESGRDLITATEADCNVFGLERKALPPQENRKVPLCTPVWLEGAGFQPFIGQRLCARRAIAQAIASLIEQYSSERNKLLCIYIAGTDKVPL